MLRRLWEKLKLLWKLAKSERASPREIGWAVAIGAFAGCTPAVGVHGWLAVGLATLFRKNRLFSWIGSRVSNMFVLPFIAYAEVQLAHRLRTGAFLTLERREILREAPNLLVDWLLGTVPVGAAIAAALGVFAWWLAHRRDRRRALAAAASSGSSDAADATPPTPSARPRRSSGSPA